MSTRTGGPCNAMYSLRLLLGTEAFVVTPGGMDFCLWALSFFASMYGVAACACRQDPPSKDQFGDGKYNVEWTKDLEKYEQWWAQGTSHTQQLARQLEEEGRPKSAARVSHQCLLSRLLIR